MTTKPRLSGFQKPVDDGKRRQVGLGVVKHHDDGISRCSCGQPFMHERIKVRENAIQRHFDKKHNGRGIIL